MEILYFNRLSSTQKYLIEKIENSTLNAPIAVICIEQTMGVGSRDNSWSGGEGNFFASIAIDIDDLPSDLPLSSASIYFSFIMKKVLTKLDKNIWLKWPNDFYVKRVKLVEQLQKKLIII